MKRRKTVDSCTHRLFRLQNCTKQRKNGKINRLVLKRIKKKSDITCCITVNQSIIITTLVDRQILTFELAVALAVRLMVTFQLNGRACGGHVQIFTFGEFAPLVFAETRVFGASVVFGGGEKRQFRRLACFREAFRRRIAGIVQRNIADRKTVN